MRDAKNFGQLPPPKGRPNGAPTLLFFPGGNERWLRAPLFPWQGQSQDPRKFLCFVFFLFPLYLCCGVCFGLRESGKEHSATRKKKGREKRWELFSLSKVFLSRTVRWSVGHIGQWQWAFDLPSSKRPPEIQFPAVLFPCYIRRRRSLLG